ncbi:MAG: TetR/AcrR family transcriptional regulator [Methylovirgula sp.]
MARPKSEDRRSAILSAATRVIAAEGLGAATATIAKEAGISNGSLFTYFETKADLLNELYLELKTEMAAAALDGLPAKSDIRRQMLHVWSHWLRWATSSPEKRRTLAHLAVSEDITPQTRQTGHQTMAGIAKLLERSRENGPMRNVPLGFVVALMSAQADATIDFMIRDPANADKHSKVAFDALWRMVA